MDTLASLLKQQRQAFDARDWDTVQYLGDAIDKLREGKPANWWVCTESASYGPLTRDEAEIIASNWAEEIPEPVWIEEPDD
jgi:hypothetical protein